jgi:hypothetical protein
MNGTQSAELGPLIAFLTSSTTPSSFVLSQKNLPAYPGLPSSTKIMGE